MRDIIRDAPVAIVAVVVMAIMTAGAVKEVEAHSAQSPIETESAGAEVRTLPVAGVSAILIEAPAEIEPVAETEPEAESEAVEIVKPDRGNAEHYMMAKLAMAEAEGESVKGKAHVIRVVLNRQESGDFPDTIPEVISQPGAFSCISGRRYDSVETNEECWEALEMVLNGWDESRGALFFERSDAKGTWQQRNRPYLFTEGNHSFYG